MTLQEKIKKDLALAMKEKDDARKNTLRIIMGEFGRMPNKSLSDAEVVQVLKKLIKAEKETLQTKGEGISSIYIEIIEGYLPRMATEADIRQWISEHIDFSEYKNKMQAMRPIMAHFGATADGNMVKAVLQSL